MGNLLEQEVPWWGTFWNQCWGFPGFQHHPSDPGVMFHPFHPQTEPTPTKAAEHLPTILILPISEFYGGKKPMESFLKGFKLLILQGREFLSHSSANAENKHIKSWKSSPKHRNLLELELELPWLQCFGVRARNVSQFFGISGMLLYFYGWNPWKWQKLQWVPWSSASPSLQEIWLCLGMRGKIKYS